jgi:phenylpyruvate tautomerase PptA (4-oxalocrotonate tautomerase family)
MPLVRIDLREGKRPEYRSEVGNVVYGALVDVVGVPANDRFQVIQEHKTHALVADPSYPDVSRSDDVLFIQITLNQGRSVEQKQNLYRAIADRLHTRLGVRREDVFIVLVEVARENWSFGNGEAQYAP